MANAHILHTHRRLSVCVLALALFASGCEFFGKEVPKSDTGGSSASSLEEVPSEMRGSWSYIDVGSSLTNTPTAAYVTRFTFNATDAHFQYQNLVTGGSLTDLTGIAAFDTSLPAVLMALTTGVDPGASYMGKTIALANPDVDGATLSYGTNSSGTRYLYVDPVLDVAPPAGVWNFSTSGLDFLVIAASGYAVAQMRDTNNDPVLMDAIARPDTDGSFTLEFFALNPENYLGSIFFYTYAVEPNGDLTLEDADGIYTGTKL